MTIAASRNSRSPLAAAPRTIRPTEDTPIKSSATTRSGRVGPRTRRTKVISIAAATIISAVYVISDGMKPLFIVPAKVEDPALKPLFDLAPGGIRRLYVHYVYVHHTPIAGNIQRHASGGDVDH